MSCMVHIPSTDKSPPFLTSVLLYLYIYIYTRMSGDALRSTCEAAEGGKLLAGTVLCVQRVLLNMTNHERARRVLSDDMAYLTLIVESSVSIPARLAAVLELVAAAVSDSDTQPVRDVWCSACVDGSVLKQRFEIHNLIHGIAAYSNRIHLTSCHHMSCLQLDGDDLPETPPAKGKCPDFDMRVHGLGLLVNMLEMDPETRQKMAGVVVPSLSPDGEQVSDDALSCVCSEVLYKALGGLSL